MLGLRIKTGMQKNRGRIMIEGGAKDRLSRRITRQATRRGEIEATSHATCFVDAAEL